MISKKVIKRKINFLKEPVTNYFKKKNYRMARDYTSNYESLEIKSKTILYESRDGKSITDSPYAIFKYLLNDPKYNDYTHIWSVEDFEEVSVVLESYKYSNKVKFVERNSKEYIQYLSTCEYLINNSTFQSFYTHKEGQKYINTWHGTPLKKMGFDIPGNPSHSQNVIRNFLSADYIISPNKHTSNVFLHSYKLKGIYEGEILESGYPRIDLTLNTKRKEYIPFLKSVGINIDAGKENILYAPTWKGTNVSKAKNDVEQIIAEMNYLEENIGTDYNILVKVHPFLYKSAKQYAGLEERLIPDYIDTNELLAVTDLLITDYSSIFFDYLVTGKPIIFYAWDSDSYSVERGQYIDYKTLPGQIVYNSFELVNAINNINQYSLGNKENYIKWQNEYVNYDDGHVTERIVKHIFDANEVAEIKVIQEKQAKKKILIYPGGMKNNGITSSFINLMDNIDHNLYDVTCFMGTPHSKEVINNIGKVKNEVRFLFKPGVPNYKLIEIYRDKFVHNRGEVGWIGKLVYPEVAYKREFKRLFGNTNFDYVIDFSGYSLFWSKYLLAAPDAKKICYMHNDLLSDSERTINGRRPHRINLRGLFSVYPRYDKLVSVSKGTMELNRKNLSGYADYNKFDYIMNSINPKKIIGEEYPENEVSAPIEFNTEGFKGRAIIINSKAIVYNTLPDRMNFRVFPISSDLRDKEITLMRKCDINNECYYKFTFNNQVYGWIKEEDIELMDDSIIESKTIDKIGYITRPRNNDIWSMPYKVEGCYKISDSLDLKGVLCSIDKEVTTQHSVYYRISIKGKVIGWIDKSAVGIHEKLSIQSYFSKDAIRNIEKQRRRIMTKNLKKFASIIDKLDNRTLYDTNVNFYAKITEPEKHSIWSKAYPNVGSEKLLDAMDLCDHIVHIRKINKTCKGTYYQFDFADGLKGWLDQRAFALLDEGTLINESVVSGRAKLNLREGKDYIWSKPYGMLNNYISEQNKDYNDKIVTFDKETRTTKGVYVKIYHKGKEIGWVDKNALSILEVEGFFKNDEFIPFPKKNEVSFVNMGRLSPEKGQDNLIKAFYKFHKSNPNSKLYILGHGPLYDDLNNLIKELQLQGSVYLVGQLENPFNFMKKCSSFILSSHYEGQPMVLLEAMTLGMKIIATDIVANRTVLEDGKYGLLVDNSIDGLSKGLSMIYDQEAFGNFSSFDYKEYNNQAMETFYKCL